MSVLDSIELRITPQNGDRVAPLGRHLSRYNTTATLQPAFPRQRHLCRRCVQQRARERVLGIGDAIDHVGRAESRIEVTATRPVLLMVPDTSKTSTVTSTTFSVYNAGVGSLDWSVASIDTAFTRCGADVHDHAVVRVRRVACDGDAACVGPDQFSEPKLRVRHSLCRRQPDGELAVLLLGDHRRNDSADRQPSQRRASVLASRRTFRRAERHRRPWDGRPRTMLSRPSTEREA